MDGTQKQLITDWLERCKKSQHVNYAAGDLYNKLYYVVGLLMIIMNAIVSSQLLDKSSGTTATILSVIACVFATIQTFFKFNEKADKYKIVSAKYGAVRRELEALEIRNFVDEDMFFEQINSIKRQMDELAIESPHIPGYLQKRK